MTVVGAGLSGLFTALLLQDQGLSVQVLEAKPRVGGRLYTLDGVPGAPEAGGVSIGAAYARLLDLAARLKLKLVPERARTSPTPATTALYYGGRAIPWDAWPASSANTFPAPYKSLRPFDLPWALPAELNPLRSQEDWQDPAFARFDTSVAAWLETLGFDSTARRAVEATLGYGNSLDDLSAVHLMHVWRFLLNALPGTYGIDGGMQRLPEAMAAALTTPVRLNAAVGAIRHDTPQTQIKLVSGETLSSKAVVLTTPVPALRNITLDPAPTGLQAQAIRDATTHAVSMFYFAAEKKFWESDGLPPGLWGDHVAERFMPQPAAGGATPDADPKEFIAYVNGREALALDKLSSANAAKAVLNDLARVRPATKGALTPLAHVSWQNDVYAGGAYASWTPGQCSALAHALPKPLGRVFFAGEQTAVSSRGMEGALESAERVAVEVLTALN